MYVAQFHAYVVFRVKCVEKRRFDQEKRRCYHINCPQGPAGVNLDKNTME